MVCTSGFNPQETENEETFEFCEYFNPSLQEETTWNPVCFQRNTFFCFGHGSRTFVFCF